MAYFVVPKAILDVLNGSSTIHLFTEVEPTVENEEILLLDMKYKATHTTNKLPFSYAILEA